MCHVLNSYDYSSFKILHLSVLSHVSVTRPHDKFVTFYIRIVVLQYCFRIRGIKLFDVYENDQLPMIDYFLTPACSVVFEPLHITL